MGHWKLSLKKPDNPSKAYGETFIFFYSIVWISFLAVIVIWRWYEKFNPNDYILVGLGISIPCILGPLLLPDDNERATPVFERYIVKANIFIFILGYLANHFYTHYFYNVLGMKYTGPLGPGRGLEINQVPVSMFLFTHPYFMTYHVLITPVLRTVKSYLRKFPLENVLFLIFVVFVATLTAFLETWTISGFPYYTYPDYIAMVTKGSVFYSTFFVITYPWFYRLDEDPKNPWAISRVIVEALAAMMAVLLGADLLKLFVF